MISLGLLLVLTLLMVASCGSNRSSNPINEPLPADGPTAHLLLSEYSPPAGMDPDTAELLLRELQRVLDEQGEMEQTAIAHSACLQLPSLTRILRNMEQEGLVSRRTDPGDRRKSLVSICKNGKALIASHADRHAAIFSRIEKLYGREKLDLLLDLLDDLRILKL